MVRKRLAKEVAEEGFDLITMYDCLHDMGDPRGCATPMRRILKPGGAWMIVEPNAGDRPDQNMNPVGRMFYNAFTMICVPTSRDQEVGAALGAQAGEARLSEVIGGGGFAEIRRATEEPLNMVLEAHKGGCAQAWVWPAGALSHVIESGQSAWSGLTCPAAGALLAGAPRGALRRSAPPAKAAGQRSRRWNGSRSATATSR